MKTILTLKTILIVFVFTTSAFGQDTLLSGIPPMAFNASAPLTTSPNNIRASDGISPTRILVEWDAVPNAKYYIVYRSPYKSGKDRKALRGKDGKVLKYTSPGMYDASEELVGGKLYYYWIAAVETPGEVKLDLQKFDPGHLIAAASDDTKNPFEATDNTTLGNQRSEVIIKKVKPTKDTISKDEKLYSEIELKNNGNSLGKNIQLTYHLSKDIQLDSKDKKLHTYYLESIEATKIYEATLVSSLGKNLNSGSYHLIIFIQEGSLIGNTVVVPITVE